MAEIRIRLDNGVTVESPASNGYYLSITRPMPYPADDVEILFQRDDVEELLKAIRAIGHVVQEEADA